MAARGVGSRSTFFIAFKLKYDPVSLSKFETVFPGRVAASMGGLP